MDEEQTATLAPDAGQRPAPLRWGLAVLCVVLAAALRWPLLPLIGPSNPFTLFYPAIMLAGWVGGLGPGLLASALSALAVWLLFLSPNLSPRLDSPVDVVQLALFLAVGVFISLLNELRHQSRRRDFAAARDLRASQTSLRHAEDEVRESEQRFRATADTAPVMIWMSGSDRRYNWFNRPWLEFTGRGLEEELGEGWQQGIHPDDGAFFRASYHAAFESRRPLRLEYRLRRGDGSYRWLLDTGVPLFAPGGTFTGYIGSCVDIHDRKEAERERERLLEAAQEANRDAEFASRTKDEFLATVSHELRTPLNAMMGWAQLLQAVGDDRDKLDRGLATIVRNAKLQAQLIDDLLDVSRIISGKMRLEVRTVDLIKVIDAAIESVRPAVEAKQIRLRRVLDPLAGPVSGDSDRLQQVIWNLLSNATKFTPKGGRIEVLLERVNSHVEVIVADTGAGIAPEFLPHVFDRFRQFDATTTRQQGGLGLGLAIVRHLVELHGGIVRVKSPGQEQGTTFIVHLPLSVAQLDTDRGPRVHPSAEGPDCKDEPALDLDGIRVLVVDDEEDAREALRHILEHCDGEVETAGTVAEALLKVENFRPDVLLSDIGMPGEDGYDLIRKLRELPAERGGRTPAVALTAFARGEDRRRALVAGFQMHLAKPVEVNELAAVVVNLARAPGSSRDR